jgi:pimeloyl-ACP methyl ester carboxylesterase
VFWAIPSLVVLVLVVLAISYWGAGLVLYPPHMSALTVFPEQFGLRYEKVSFTTQDGLTLKGWFLPSPSGDERTLLMCHGWGDNKGELLKKTYFLNQQAGFNLFYFDHRSHGESQGEITTIGYLETIDFSAAVEYLRKERPRCLKRLGVFGLSMGAAVAAMSAFRHPEIKAVVLESPFTDYRQVIRQWAWINCSMPYFPLVMISLWILRLRVGEAKVDTYSPIRYIRRLSPRPVFILSGAEDDLMPQADVRRLYEAAEEPKQLWIIPEAEHGRCHEVAGLEYETRVTGFFTRSL